MTLPPPKIPRWIRALLIVPLLVFGLAAVFAPPAISFGLIRRGVSDGRHAWTVLGALIGLLWLLLFGFLLRRLRRPRVR